MDLRASLYWGYGILASFFVVALTNQIRPVTLQLSKAILNQTGNADNGIGIGESFGQDYVLGMCRIPMTFPGGWRV